MLHQMVDKKEEHFFLRQDLEPGEVLELGITPKDIQMEEVGKWVMWGPAIEPAPEGLPLAPLTEALWEDWYANSTRGCCHGG